jgi:hypothetical protein
VGAVGIKRGDIGGGIAKASGIPNCTGVVSGMAEPTRIVDDHAKMAESI